MMEPSLKNGKPFDYYPRGRVEIRNGKATIFLNLNIFNNDIKNFLIRQFCLDNEAIKKVVMIADNSEHYRCHLDMDTDKTNWFDIMKDVDPELYKKFCGDK